MKLTIVSLAITLCLGCASASTDGAVSASFASATTGTQSLASVGSPPSTTTMSVTVVRHATGANDVVLQIGDYHLGFGPDGFVSGPEIVLYGDGRLYAELFDDVRNGEPRSSLEQAQLTEQQMQTLLEPGEAMSENPTMNTLPADSFPTLIVSALHRWEVNDPQQEPFRTYLTNLRVQVRSIATAAWVPNRWITRPFPTTTCTVTKAPAEHTYYDAPIFPGDLDRYPQGDTDCDAEP